MVGPGGRGRNGQCLSGSDYNNLMLAARQKDAILLFFRVPRQFVYGHFVYDISSTDISSTDISSTTVGLYQATGQLYIQLLFQKIIIFINSDFYLHYDSL